MHCERGLNAVPSQTVTLVIPDAKTFRRGALIAVGIAILVYLAWVVREIWVPLGLAFVLAIVLDPVVDRMEAKGWKRVWASALIFVGAIVVFGLALWFTFPLVAKQFTDAQGRFAQFFPDTSREGLVKSFRKLNAPESVAAVGANAFENAQKGLSQSSSYLTKYGMSFVSNLIWVVIIPIVAFFALVDFHTILSKALLLVPRTHRNATQTYISEVSAVFAKYLRGLAILSIMNGIATGVVLSVLRVPSALVVGVVAGVLYSVPYIGAMLTIVVTAAVAFIGGGVHMMILAVGVSVVLHQIVFDQFISPRLLGGTVGLHPILSIIALLAGNLLLGIIGMILAVPIAACIQILVLALVPKLRVEVETDGVPTDNEGGALAAQSREILAQSGKTADGELASTVQRAKENTEEAEVEDAISEGAPVVVSPIL